MITSADDALDIMFRKARTHNAWTDRPVPDSLLHELYEITKFGPTSANCSPARFVFVRTPESKEKLRPALSKGNLDKTMSAPVVVLVAEGRRILRETAQAVSARRRPRVVHLEPRNGAPDCLPQHGAARRLSHTRGARAGDSTRVRCRASTQKLLTTPSLRARLGEVNFLINLGYGDPKGLFPRSPRLDFDEACRLA